MKLSCQGLRCVFSFSSLSDGGMSSAEQCDVLCNDLWEKWTRVRVCRVVGTAAAVIIITIITVMQEFER
jgi:hypothetical protein